MRVGMGSLFALKLGADKGKPCRKRTFRLSFLRLYVQIRHMQRHELQSEKASDPLVLWSKAASQLLRALRASRSQRMLAKRLGYAGNPVRDWEAGRRFPTAAEALRAAGLCGVDVHAALRRFHPRSALVLAVDATAPTPDDARFAAWLRDLRGTTAISDLAARSELSRYSISRWLKGESRPRLPEALALIDAMSGRASDLVAELVEIDEVPVLLALHHQRTTAKELAFVDPWTEAVMRLVETAAYRNLPAHDDTWVAQRLGIETETAARCIARMIDSGLVALEGGRLQSKRALTIFTGGDATRARRLKAHWAHVASDRLASGDEADWFAYNLMSVSRADMERIRGLLQSAYKEIRAIVAASSPEETVGLLQLQLIDWQLDRPVPQAVRQNEATALQEMPT